MKRMLAATCALVIAVAGMTVLAAELESGLQVGQHPGAYNVKDITGPSESDHVDLATQIKKIETIRDVSRATLGVPLVLNARTDIFLLPIGPEATRFGRTVARLRAYRQAGADCVFAPGIKDAAIIAEENCLVGEAVER